IGGVSRHAGNAAAALATAASTSSRFENGTVRMTRPVAASVTGPDREARDAVLRPSTHNGTAPSTTSACGTAGDRRGDDIGQRYRRTVASATRSDVSLHPV